MRWLAGSFVMLASLAQAQAPVDRAAAALMEQANAFREHARGLVTEESLVQRCYRVPPHRWILVGDAPPLRAEIVVTEVASDYSIGSLKNDKTGTLVEFREILRKNGTPQQTPAAARKALQMDISSGEDRIRRKIVAAFSDLGLLDVATDYGLLLLLFTRSGMEHIRLDAAGTRFAGAEEAFVFDWSQTEGGLLELRGGKSVRRPMHGQVWVAKSDGAPLRITAALDYQEPKHRLRDSATVEFVRSAFGCVVPVTVVHRHFVDGTFLTENLYQYGPFRLFETDTRIRYETSPGK